jgi:hypothetical protein
MRLGEAVSAHVALRRCGWPLPAIHFWHNDREFAFVVEAQMSGHRVDAVPAFCRAYYGVWNLSWAFDTSDEEEVLRIAEVLGVA